MPAISVQNLSMQYRQSERKDGLMEAVKAVFHRTYKTKTAVDNISLSIEPGEIVGFLGPNGAGKTTTIKILTGILRPTSGTVSVLGYTPFDRKPEYQRRIALVMGNKQQLWWDLPAMDSFKVLGQLYDVEPKEFEKRVDYLTECLNLKELLYRPVRQLSLGERMKCELVASLIHNPEIVFLDEPTLGLDLVSQQRIRDFLKEFNQKESSTLLLTSHYMQDVEELCRRVIVIDNGTIVFDGPITDLTEKYDRRKYFRLQFSQPIEAADLSKFGTVEEVTEESALIIVDRDQVRSVASALFDQLPIVDVSVQAVPLENVIRDLFSYK